MRTIDRIFDGIGLVFNLLLLLGGAALLTWGVCSLVKHHVTFQSIGHAVGSFVNDMSEDETGYVQAMRNAGYNDDANDALDAGHRICKHMREDGSTPTEAVNAVVSRPHPGISDELVRRLAFSFVTNAQVYLCPDTLHNAGTPTPTTVTVTSTAPVPTATRAPTAPPTMVTAPPYYCGQYPSGTGCPEITPTTPSHQPDWKQYCATPVDRTECDNAPPMNAPTTTVPPTLVATTDETP